MAHTKQFRHVPSRKTRFLTKYWPILIGLALVVAAISLIAGLQFTNSQKNTAVAQRDATADQALTLADQVARACADPGARQALPSEACAKADQVKADPVPPVAGAPGSPGSEGPPGDQGLQGVPGSQGAAGGQGEQGLQGQTGSQGAAGGQGDQGLQGVPGQDGSNGTNGSNGVDGVPGPQGVPGAVGAPGRGISRIDLMGSPCRFVITYTDGETGEVPVDSSVCPDPAVNTTPEG